MPLQSKPDSDFDRVAVTAQHEVAERRVRPTRAVDAPWHLDD
jgi:hypothetical protein